MQGLSEFCREHSNLEHLCFDTSDYADEMHDYSIGDGNWALEKLKTLSYVLTIPQQGLNVIIIIF